MLSQALGGDTDRHCDGSLRFVIAGPGGRAFNGGFLAFIAARVRTELGRPRWAIVEAETCRPLSAPPAHWESAGVGGSIVKAVVRTRVAAALVAA
jgi:hypothetical protein